MEKKLTIAHIAPYLPYGLKVQDIYSGKIDTITSLYDIIEYDDIKIKIGHSNAEHIWMFKPILRPLSQLTQEIEHNGERFVPVDKLEDMFRWNPEWFGWDTFIKDANLNSLDYDVIKQLIKWHFDIFQLCESGLAIEKGAEG